MKKMNIDSMNAVKPVCSINKDGAIDKIPSNWIVNRVDDQLGDKGLINLKTIDAYSQCINEVVLNDH